MSDQAIVQAPQQQQTKPTEALAVVEWQPRSATEAWQLAKYYGSSSLLPKALRNTGDVFVAISAGRDFGWSPMQSFRGIYVVEGKPCLSADSMVGIAKAGGACEYFRLVESTAKVATYETKRKGDPEPVRLSFTIEEAQVAGLAGKAGPWKSYPARMLRNRCKSALAKEVYEDLLFGCYEESEAEELAKPIRRSVPAEQPPPRAAEQVVEGEVADGFDSAVARAREAVKPEPPHDAQTGEVAEPAEPTVAGKLRIRIEAAIDAQTLTVVGAEIKQAADVGAITAEERASLRAVFQDRFNSLANGKKA